MPPGTGSVGGDRGEVGTGTPGSPPCKELRVAFLDSREPVAACGTVMGRFGEQDDERCGSHLPGPRGTCALCTSCIAKSKRAQAQ
jgi:hypothetical protein